MKQETRTNELREHLTDLHIRIKETLRMQVALERILNNAPECQGPHILADVVKNRLGAMDLYVKLIADLIPEEEEACCEIKPTKEIIQTGSTVFPAQTHEIIDADARQAAIHGGEE